jgi:putative exosortase-affiliated protein, TIGR04073 family
MNMSKTKTLLFTSLLAISAFSPAQADGYFSEVSEKFLRGGANLFTGMGEVPKNIVWASGETNPTVGFTGGIVGGTLDVLGRTASGIFDVITSPIPTKSLVEPAYVWDDFGKPTTYGTNYRQGEVKVYNPQ